MPERAIYLLSTPTIQQAEETITFSHNKAVALLAYLAVSQRPHSRDALAGLLWPDEEQSKARAELRRMLWVINKALEPSWLESNRQTVGLAETADIYIDVYQFEQLLASWQLHGHDSHTLCPQCAADLSTAIDLYQDDFMAGFALYGSDNFERWQQQQAAARRQALAEALDKLMFWHWAQANSAFVKMAQRRLKLNPTHEPTHRLLMIYYAKEQQVAAALTQYKECVTALATELALEPASETTTLYQQIGNGRFPHNNWQDTIDWPYKTQTESPTKVNRQAIKLHNLPAQITPFVGRKTEIKHLSQLISDETIRFVSIIAPGGMGKTRLVLEIGQQLLPNFANGVFFVELAPLKDGDGIIPTLAEAVGYAFQQNGRSQKQQILDYLAHKEMLLILDNFEHLLTNAALTQELLQAAPQLKLLVTSRQRLGQYGETLFTLTGMGLPDWHSTETAFNYASIQLFQQTARRARPDFKVTAVNLPHIIRICQLVAGMPLGILLAASWMSLLSAKEIADEIQQGLDILESEGDEVVARQRSIRVVCDSTWHMLSHKEQQAFMKMSLFRGGFSRQAAQQVTGANLRQLQSLINKSLIYREANSGRYQIHELLRQYAEEQLFASGEIDQITAVYIHYFLSFLASQTALLKQQDQLDALRYIEADFENIRASWFMAIASRTYALLDRAVEAMTLFCFLTSRLEDGKSLFNTERFDDAEARAHPVWHRFTIRFYGIEEETAVLLTKFHHTLTLAQAREDLAETAFCHVTLATLIHYLVQDPMQAIEHYDQAVTIYRQLDEKYYLAQTLSKLGEAHQLAGQGEQNWQYINEARDLQRHIGDQLGESETLRALGMATYQDGRYPLSLEYLEQAYALQRETNFIVGQASSHLYGGWMHYIRGDMRYGRQRIETALKLALEVVDYSTQAWCYAILSLFDSAGGDYIAAEKKLHQAKAIAPDPFRQSGAGNPFMQLHIDWAETELHAAATNVQAVKRLLIPMLDLACQTDSHPYTTYFMVMAAFLYRYEEQLTKAVELLGLALAQAQEATAWMTHWQLLKSLRTELADELGPSAFQMAWQRGQSLGLLATARSLLEELSV